MDVTFENNNLCWSNSKISIKQLIIKIKCDTKLYFKIKIYIRTKC